MRDMSVDVEQLASKLKESFTLQLDDMRALSNLSNQQVNKINTALDNISAIEVSQNSIEKFDSNITKLGERLNNLVTNTNTAGEKLADFATSTSAVSTVLVSSGKIVKNTETTANNLDRLQNELQDIVTTANNEKNKLASTVAEISNEIKQAKLIIAKTSDLSLQMEKTIEERMASVLKLVRNG